MFKKRQTKAELRQQMQAEVAAFVKKGGAIQQVQMGESGLIDGRYNSAKPAFTPAKNTERTPVGELLSVIDARRKKKSAAATKPTRKPRKKVIYDDFGEPLRTVWVDK